MKYTFRNILEHTNDDVKNVGYDYGTKGLLNRYLSPILFENVRRFAILYKIDGIIIALIDEVKEIKHRINFMMDEKWRNFN